MLPKIAGSAQTHKSISFIWIICSTLCVYLWFSYECSKQFKWNSCYYISGVSFVLFPFYSHFNLVNSIISLVPNTVEVEWQLKMLFVQLLFCWTSKQIGLEDVCRFKYQKSDNLQYNMLGRWVAWSLGRTSHRPSIWCYKHYFFS